METAKIGPDLRLETVEEAAKIESGGVCCRMICPKGKHSTVNYHLEALPVIDSSTRKQKNASDYTPPPPTF